MTKIAQAPASVPVALSDKEISEGFFTSDGWFFLGNNHYRDLDQALGIHRPDKKHAEHWADTLKEIDIFCARRDVRTIFSVGPAKWAIYPEKLRDCPGYVRRRKTQFDLLLQACRNRGVEVLDFRPVLIAGRSTADTYSPRDSHWSAFGAANVWGEMAAAIRTKMPSIALFDPFPIASVHYTDEMDEATALSGQIGMNRHARAVLTHPFPPFEISFSGSPWEWSAGSRTIPLAQLPYRTRNGNAPNAARALIIRDSVGDQLSPYFHSAFSETVQTYHHINHLAYVLDIPALVRRHAPDILIFILTERYLTQPWPDVSMVKTANMFDNASDVPATWPTAIHGRKLSVTGHDYLTQPVQVRIPAHINGPAVLRVEFTASSAGTMSTSYSSEGKPVQASFAYSAGHSELYCWLPAAVDHGHFWMIDGGVAGSTFIGGIAISEI